LKDIERYWKMLENVENSKSSSENVEKKEDSNVQNMI
jgi:hypothetical protein